MERVSIITLLLTRAGGEIQNGDRGSCERAPYSKHHLPASSGHLPQQCELFVHRHILPTQSFYFEDSVDYTSNHTMLRGVWEDFYSIEVNTVTFDPAGLFA